MVVNAETRSGRAVDTLSPAPGDSPRLLGPEELQSLISLLGSPEITAEQRASFDATSFHSSVQFREPVSEDE